MRLVDAGELDDDDRARPRPLLDLDLRAVDEESTAERVERCLDALQVVEHVVVELRGAQVGDGVGTGHASSVTEPARRGDDVSRHDSQVMTVRS